MNSYSYTSKPTAQALGAAMMPLDVQNVQSPQAPVSSVMGLSSEAMQHILGGNAPTVQSSLIPSNIPQDAISYNNGAGQLPWLSQNQLPWLQNGGN